MAGVANTPAGKPRPERKRGEFTEIEEFILLPKVKKFSTGCGALRFCAPFKLIPSEDLSETLEAAAESFGEFFALRDDPRSAPEVRFLRVGQLNREGYRLDIGASGVEIRYSYPNGAFYALMTLRQMLINGVLPHCRIEDEPELSLRGYMLDVSRGKLPKLATLKATVDTLASLKYNHLEMYFEGSPFVYPGFGEYALPDAYTAEELSELDRYCRARCIELVPNCNTLGHMSPWLARGRFRRLAEAEDGLNVFGMTLPPTTLNCRDPEALDFVLSLIDGLTPCFSSKRIHVGLDEPFELGKGKNAAYAARYGAGKLYIDYADRLCGALKKRGLTMWMWGDIAARTPGVAESLPKDIVLLDWGYQAEYPFETRAAELKKSGKRFLLCPGTASWQSIGGMTDNMLANVTRAALAAKAYGAEGLLLTDWGDGGHMQASFVSLPAIALAAGLSWADSLPENDLKRALDVLVFRDGTGTLGETVLELGRYCRFEEFALECRTLATLPIQFPEARGSRCEKIEDGLVKFSLRFMPAGLKEIYRAKAEDRKPFDLRGFDADTETLSARTLSARPKCADAAILTDEISNTILLISTLERARLSLKQDKGNPALACVLNRAAAEFSRLWLLRNRPGDLAKNLAALETLAHNLER